VRGGRLRYRVTIQQPGTASQNSQGDDTTPWVTLKEVYAHRALDWAGVLRRGDPTERGHAHDRDAVPLGITTKMRVTRGTRIFDIKAVIDPMERHRELQLLCTERV
jgi:head-tail adaptor